jgi:RND family efflux transporter MFP subunit
MMPRSTVARLVPLVAALMVAACAKPAATTPSAGDPRPVRVAPVTVEALGDGVRAVGILAPKNEARLSFKVGGIIESIHAEEGARVRGGQVLAVLKQAEIGAAVTQAREAAAKSARDLERAKALYADGVASREQFEDAGTAAAVSAAGLASAEFNARHARIVASGEGVVLRKLAETGEAVAAGQPVVVVGSADRGWIVRVALADRDIVRVHVGDAAAVSFDAWPGRAFTGRVANLSASADPATGTFTVEVAVSADGAGFVQGLVAKVALNPARGAATTVVPVQALVEANGDEASVFVLDPKASIVRRVAIRVGRLSGTQVEVLGGLEPGALVVIDGGAYLENGEAVRIATAAPPAGRPRT